MNNVKIRLSIIISTLQEFHFFSYINIFTICSSLIKKKTVWGNQLETFRGLYWWLHVRANSRMEKAYKDQTERVKFKGEGKQKTF